eukprot:scaffold7346_cov245-Pinguiococcus_pyrenoidosus.AAC.1
MVSMRKSGRSATSASAGVADGNTSSERKAPEICWNIIRHQEMDSARTVPFSASINEGRASVATFTPQTSVTTRPFEVSSISSKTLRHPLSSSEGGLITRDDELLARATFPSSKSRTENDGVLGLDTGALLPFVEASFVFKTDTTPAIQRRCQSSSEVSTLPCAATPRRLPLCSEGSSGGWTEGCSKTPAGPGSPCERPASAEVQQISRGEKPPFAPSPPPLRLDACLLKACIGTAAAV